MTAATMKIASATIVKKTTVTIKKTQMTVRRSKMKITTVIPLLSLPRFSTSESVKVMLSLLFLLLKHIKIH